MGLMNALERRIGIKNTRAFINANRTEVVLRRPKVKLTAAGGRVKTDPDLLTTQDGRIVPMSGLVWDRTRTTPDEGVVPDVTEILIMLPTADVKQDDYFPNDTSLGGWYEVVHVSAVEGYRKEARLRWHKMEPKA